MSKPSISPFPFLALWLLECWNRHVATSGRGEWWNHSLAGLQSQTPPRAHVCSCLWHKTRQEMDIFNNHWWAEWKIGKLRGHTPTCERKWHETMSTKSYLYSTQFLLNQTFAKGGSDSVLLPPHRSTPRCVSLFYNILLSPEFCTLKVNTVVGCVWWHCALLQHNFSQTLQTEDKKKLFQTNAANLVAAGFLIPVFSLDLRFIAFCFFVFFNFSQCVVCSSLAKSMKPYWFYLCISPECVWCEFLSNHHFFLSLIIVRSGLPNVISANIWGEFWQNSP